MMKNLMRAAAAMAVAALVWPLWAQDDPEEGAPRREDSKRQSPERVQPPGTPRTPMTPGPDGRRGMPPMNPEEAAKLLTKAVDFLNGVDKSQADELQRLWKSDEPGMREQAMRMLNESMELIRLKDQEPDRFKSILELRKAETETLRLGREFREATPERQKTIKDELRAKLDKLFELREADRQSEITRMEKELARLKDLVAKRRQKKDAIIESRMGELTGEREETGW